MSPTASRKPATWWDKLSGKVPKTLSQTPNGLTFRKLANKEGHERVTRYHPETGERYLINPRTGEPENWPVLGMVHVGPIPQSTVLSTTLVQQGIAEGWIEADGADVVHASGGPPANPWAVTHTFITYDWIRLKLLDETVTYKVVHNPGKYPDPDEPGKMRVDWFYLLERVS